MLILQKKANFLLILNKKEKPSEICHIVVINRKSYFPSKRARSKF